MNSPPPDSERPNLRASDKDREHMAEVLREAAGEGRLSLEELDQRLDAVYAAKTYAELEPIARDLPAAGTVHPPEPAPPPGPAADPRRFGGQPGSTSGIAILSGFTRKGDWVVPKEFNAVAILGGGEIDMREARFAEPTVTIHAVAVMGGIEITVPEDATVHVNGVGILGGFDDNHDKGGGQPGGPTIIVNGVAFLGGIEVSRRPPQRSRQDRLDARRERLQSRMEDRRDIMEARVQARQDRLEARLQHKRERLKRRLELSGGDDER